jgi:hypothetical protein
MTVDESKSVPVEATAAQDVQMDAPETSISLAVAEVRYTSNCIHTAVLSASCRTPGCLK